MGTRNPGNGHRDFAGDTPILTVADVNRLQSEVDADEKALAEKRERLAAALTAARFFLPSEPNRSVPAEKKAAPVEKKPRVLEAAKAESGPDFPWGKPTWVATLLHVLERAGGGMPHRQALDEIIASPVYPQLTHGFKNFYAAMERLKKKGEVISHGGVLYTRKAFQELMASGKKLPSIPRRKVRTVIETVTELLEKHGELTAPRLEEIAREMTDVPRNFQTRNHYGAQMLKDLESKGVVVSKNGVYRLPGTGTVSSIRAKQN